MMIKNSAVFLLYLLVCFAATGQTTGAGGKLVHGNFIYHDGRLVWQKTFETNLTVSEQISRFKSLETIDLLISEADNQITIKSRSIDHDFRHFGQSEFFTTIIVARTRSLGTVAVQFKENRYRVTFSNIEIEQKKADVLFEKGEITMLASIIMNVKRTKFRAFFVNKDDKIFEFSYSRAFDISTSATLEDDF